MGYPTKVQLIRRKASQQWYVNFPSALAQAMCGSPAARPWNVICSSKIAPNSC